MFHELLLALNGIPGCMFLETSEGLKISSRIQNLHPAEKNIFGRLCSLATKYKNLYEFEKQHRYHKSGEEHEIFGLYLESFCCGLNTVLDVYRQELTKLENDIIHDPFLPVTYFLKLEEFQMQFEVLSDLIMQIKEDKAHGCQILELIYNHSSSGVSMVEMAVNKIHKHCLTVLYRQVFCWMMHGYVEDPYEEFFIQPEVASDEMQMNQNKQCFSATLHGLQSESDQRDNLNRNYIIKAHLLPSYIPSNLAAKILFVGQYVSILRRAKNLETYLMFLKKEHHFAKKIMTLQEKPVFSLLHFETTIDDIRTCAAEHLCQVIVKGANLIMHLKTMKDFYLLGKGELFVNFIGEAKRLLRMPVTTTAEHDVNQLFHAVARQTYPDDDNVTEKFRVTLHHETNRKSCEIDKESLSKTKLESGWSSIGLVYEVSHPLHILITPKVIDRYNIVFRFLLSVRKVQIELHACWALQMRVKGAGRDSSFACLWQLRSHMAFFVDNFQYYILVDVLESQFSILLDKMNSVKDFEAIQQYHEHFLSSVVSQCFLELKPLYHLLNEILETCSSFCNLMNRTEIVFNQRDITQYEHIKLNFQRQTSLLFRALLGMRSHQVSPHLAQLLLRIDFNKYLSCSGGHLGGPENDGKKSNLDVRKNNFDGRR